jgi:UDP-glucose 4-epimerase
LKIVLITGVTGFIGRHVALLFSELGWQVVGIGTCSDENASLENLYYYKRLKLPSSELTKLIQQFKPQVCVHCIGRASVALSISQPYEDFNTSVCVTFELLNALRLYAPECRSIYLSSAAVYGNPEKLPIREDFILNPISPYGFHKLVCEQLCAEFSKVYGMQIAIARIFSAYGSGLRRQVIWDISQKVLRQSVLRQSVLHLQGTGSESRDFIHVKDVARALYFLAENSLCNADVYNIASGQETTINDLARLIIAESGRTIEIEFDGIIPAGNPINWKADIKKLLNIGYAIEVPIKYGVGNYFRWCKMEVI